MNIANGQNRVCAAGAGPAGLAMGRALSEAGVAFEIFERHPGAGGIWNPRHFGSPMYQAAHFISSKRAPVH
jgi:cation diffusion facilitator CzcD-associated flavoprotein CzcO